MPLVIHAPTGTLTVDAVICDMDGLLIDSEGLSLFAWQDTLTTYGVTLVDQDILDMFGMRIVDDAALLIERYHLPTTVNDLVAERMAIMAMAVRRHLQPMPGALDFVTWLHTNNVPLALATSGVKTYANLCLEVTGLAPYFPIRITGDQVQNGKPAPDIFLKAAQCLDLRPERCLILEDAPLGVAAAIAAGSPVIAIPNVYTAEQKFPLPTARAGSLYDVLAWLTVGVG
jgi:HAD superfamily hydrolase (TIGR01509 family)